MSRDALACRGWTRRACLQAGAAGAAALLAGLPARLRAEPGFEVLDLEAVDATRSRPVPMRLYRPRAASAAAPVPLVVFSHGIGGSRRGYSYLGQHLAAHGVACLHLQHVGSDRGVWTGNVFSMLDRLQAAAQDAEAIDRAHDWRFALDTVLAGADGAAFDRRHIVAAGHSYGANTTLLKAGARVEREGSVIELADRRVSAAVVISAPPFYGERDLQPILGPVRVPSLHITATEDVIRIPGYYSGVQDRLQVFDAVGSPRKWLAVFEGGSHSIFTDRGGTGGVALNPQVKAATRELVLGFVRAQAGGDPTLLQRWPQQHAALLADFRYRALTTA